MKSDVLETVTGGYRIRVHATPAAGDTRIGGTHDGALRIRVAQPAEKGKANQAIRKLVAKAIRVPASQVTIVGGVNHRRKTLEIRNQATEIADRISRLAALNDR